MEKRNNGHFRLRFSRGRSLLVAVVLAAVVRAGNAPGQTLPTGQDEALRLDTIVVTAEKSEENLQAVPASITAFTADRIEDSGIDSFRDFALQVPTLFTRAELQMIGPFYWNDANTLEQTAYELVNLRLGLETRYFDIVLWARTSSTPATRSWPSSSPKTTPWPRPATRYTRRARQ